MLLQGDATNTVARPTGNYEAPLERHHDRSHSVGTRPIDIGTGVEHGLPAIQASSARTAERA
jgi:hypothetical protein